jgi:hypothetical protein
MLKALEEWMQRAGCFPALKEQMATEERIRV